MTSASPPVIADLVAMRDLAQQVLLPQLSSGPVHAGPDFDGSRLVPADADVIVGDTLLDFKADQGGRPRLDGSRSAVLHRNDVHQLLGYVLMDTSDRYHLRHAGVYFARFGHFARWALTDLLVTTTGDSNSNLVLLRSQFADLLRQTRTAADQARAERRHRLVVTRAAAGIDEAATGRQPGVPPGGVPSADVP